MLPTPSPKTLILKLYCRQTKQRSSSGLYVIPSSKIFPQQAYSARQERELEKVNAFYLQKEAEVCLTTESLDRQWLKM